METIPILIDYENTGLGQFDVKAWHREREETAQREAEVARAAAETEAQRMAVEAEARSFGGRYRALDESLGGRLPFGAPRQKAETPGWRDTFNIPQTFDPDVSDPSLRMKAAKQQAVPFDWHEAIGGGVPMPEDPVIKALAQGWGDVLQSIGGAAKWAGQKDIGGKLIKAGENIQELNKFEPGTPGEHGLGLTAIRSIPFTASLLPVGIAGAAGGSGIAGLAGLGALGKVLAGTAGAVALSRPLESLMEAGGSYNDALAKGWEENQAAQAATKTFLANLPLGVMDFAEIGTAFIGTKFLPKPLSKAIEKGLKSKFGRATMEASVKVALPAVTEGLEEGIQDTIQKWALKEPNPWALDEEKRMSMAIGALFGGALGGAGAVTDLKAGQSAAPSDPAAPAAVPPVAPSATPGQPVTGGGQILPLGRPVVPPGSPVVPAGTPVVSTDAPAYSGPVLGNIETKIPSSPAPTEKGGLKLPEIIPLPSTAAQKPEETVGPKPGEEPVEALTKEFTEEPIKPTTEEPWQMTKEGYVTEAQKVTGRKPEMPHISMGTFRKHWEKQHRIKVEEAVKKGNLVPPEVLKDYPDLAQQAKEKPGALGGKEELQTKNAGYRAGKLGKTEQETEPTKGTAQDSSRIADLIRKSYDTVTKAYMDKYNLAEAPEQPILAAEIADEWGRQQGMKPLEARKKFKEAVAKLIEEGKATDIEFGNVRDVKNSLGRIKVGDGDFQLGTVRVRAQASQLEGGVTEKNKPMSVSGFNESRGGIEPEVSQGWKKIGESQEEKGATPARVRNVFRGKKGAVRVEFPDSIHADLFAYPSKLKKAAQEGKGDIEHEAGLLKYWLRLGGEADNLGAIAQDYHKSVMDAVKDLPKKSTYKAQRYEKKAAKQEAHGQPEAQQEKPPLSEVSESTDNYVTGEFADYVIRSLLKDGKITNTDEDIIKAFDAFFMEEYSDDYISSGFKVQGYKDTLDELYKYYRTNEGKVDLVARARKSLEVKVPEATKQPDNIQETPLQSGQKSDKLGGRGQTNPHVKIADFVEQKLKNKEKFTSLDLLRIADEAYGGTQAQGKYTPKDAYDALELGVNKYLEEQLAIDSTKGIEHARSNLAALEELLSLLPTQTKRTAEQDEFQQFSTPPNLAYVAAWTANFNKGDTALEPSAGIGGLAVFAKKAGAEVVVNELTERRLELLKEMGFDKVFNEDAEQIDNILPDSVKPTVVIMNPPFSTAAGRMKGVKKTSFAEAHIEQALSRLEPDGRLVAIVGRGMSDSAATFEDWWKKVKAEYNVRANVGIDGSNYKKYGTSFDVQLLVIDKIGATPEGATITGSVTKLEDVLPLLEVVRNDRTVNRPAQQTTGKYAGEEVSQTGEAEAGPGLPIPVSTTEVGAGERGSESAGGRKSIRKRGPSGRSGKASAAESAESNGLPPEGRPGGREPVGETGPVSEAEETSRRGGVPPGQDTSGTGGTRTELQPGIKVESQEVQTSGEELTDAVFTAYKPQKLRIPGAQPHPGHLAQSAAMAAVEPPKPTYTPNLPKEIIKDGKLSIAQLESVVYAGQAHQQTLPGGQRRGFFIGDGTGVGKGREISAIILDNMRQGRKKAVWISKNNPLFTDAKRDFGDVGGNADLLFELGKVKQGMPVKQLEGVLFTTYNTLSQNLEISRDGELTAKKDKQARIDQLVGWLGKDFDGVIAFDEAHHMQNSLAMKGKRGMTKPSAMALAGVELQKRLPNARVVYVSATGATEVANLAYADCLGLWGEGTPFSDKRDFVTQIQSGGLAAMELVARDMKAMGLYIARNLSYEDVTYGTIQHDLSHEQLEIYDAMAEGWQSVLQNIHKALEVTGQQKNGNAKANVMSAFWGSQQRFFNQILTSMQMPSAVEAAKKDLTDGHAVVMQLVNTNEAAQNRQIAKMEEGDSLEDLDLTPRDMLMQYIDKSFPTQQYEEYMDDNENVRARPVFDSQGNPVQNRQAVAMKERLLDKLGSMKVPEGPLEIILNTFGVENVAEVTGRTRRVVKVKDESGRLKAKIESRTPKHAEADANAFMDDKKKILVFSDAGGTGRSYHASLNAKNQRRRIHYLIQPGWRADSAVQGFGRTHRTNQAGAPHYVLVTTSLKGQKRFISSIARRLDQLGALTKGQRQTGSQGLFSAKDNLESGYARDALQRFYEDLVKGQIKGLNDQELLKKMGLEGMLDDQANLKELPVLRDITKFLNRILALESNLQNDVFDAFSDRLDAIVEKAIEAGTLDVGLENFRADKVKVLDEKTVDTDTKSGAETRYVELKASYKNKPLSYGGALKLSRLVGIYRNTRSGRVYAVRQRGMRTTQSGSVVYVYELHGQSEDNVNSIDKPKFDSGNWEEVKGDEAQKLWNEALDKLPEYRDQKVHLVTGAILPIWDRLPGEQVRVIRVKTDDGRVMLGRIIPERLIDVTLSRLNVQRNKQELSPAEIVKRILEEGYRVDLANGWGIVRKGVSGEYRIEIIGNDLYRFTDQLKKDGVFTERIQFNTRYFIPTGEGAAGAFAKVTAHRPVIDVVSPDGLSYGATTGKENLREEHVGGSTSARGRLSKKVDEAIGDVNPPMGGSIKIVGNGKQKSIVISGNELGENLTQQEIRKKAAKYATANFKGKTIRNLDTGFDIKIVSSGIKHVISLSGDIRKAKAIVALSDILKYSIYVGAEKSYKPDQNIKSIHRFRVNAKIGNESVVVNSVIRETNEGKLFYDYRLSNVENIEPAGTPESMNQNGSKLFGATGSNKKIPQEPAKVKGEYNGIENGAIRKRFEAAKGVPKETLLARAKEFIRNLWHVATREYERLPRTAEFAQFRSDLLKLAKQKGVQSDETLRILQGLTINLNRKQFNTFRHYVILADLVEEMNAGHDLPFGFDADTLTHEWDMVQDAVNSDPEIQQAIQERKDVWDEIIGEYVEAQEKIGHHVEGKFNRQNYYRHQVLEYAQAKSLTGTGKRLKTPTGRGFLKKREGSALDINTDYLQAEYEVMARMLYDIEVAETISRVDQRYNIFKKVTEATKQANKKAMDSMIRVERAKNPDGISSTEMALKSFRQRIAMGFAGLRKLAKSGVLWDGKNGEYADVVSQLANEDIEFDDDAQNRTFRYFSELLGQDTDGAMQAGMILKAVSHRDTFIRDRLGRQFKTWEDMIPDGYTAWQPREGNIFFMADTVPAQIADQIYNQIVTGVGVKAKDLNKILAMGGKRPAFVVKEEVALTLDNLVKDQKLNPLLKPFADIQRYWKIWQLVSMRRWFKYNFRNLSGDAEAVFVGNPDSFKYVPQAIKELYPVFAADKPMPKNVRDWFERGGMETLLQAQELGDINKLKMFVGLEQSKGKPIELLTRMWQGYWKTARISTDFREAILRYASYLSYLEQMESNPEGKPKNFGASIREEVMALDDIKDRAFKLSNELLGAYDQVGVVGQELRRYLIPFWSWNEVNFRRTKQLFFNAARDSGLARMAVKKWFGTLAIRSPFVAYNIGKFALKAAGFWVLLQLWNEWKWPEEEASLPMNVRSRPHIIFGRDADGKVVYFERLGFVQDFLEWFGMDESPLVVRDWLNGKRTLKEIAVDMAKSPLNKIVNGIGPLWKTPTEVLVGKTFFPDIFKQRTIRDRWEYLANSLGLGNEYKALAGKPMQTYGGSRAEGYWRSWEQAFVYKADPMQSAYYDILDEKRRYLKKKGKDNSASYVSPKSNALYNIKLSVRYKDREAFNRYLLEYAELGGTAKGLEQSLRSMHPLYGLNKEDQLDFIESLDTEDRGKMLRALKYYETVLVGKG